MNPAMPWLGPFAHSPGLTGPFALLTAATNALRAACCSSPRLAALARRLAEAERERVTTLAQTHTGLDALGRELLKLGHSLGFPEANGVALLDSGTTTTSKRLLPPQAQRAPELGAASRARPPGDGGPRRPR